MLQSFDTLIGFAVIMALLSLLITIATQMFSAALSLRGKNLANALSVTLRTIDPDIGQHAEAVVEHVLQRPGISDSIFSSTRPAAPVAATQAEIAAADNLICSDRTAGTAQTALDNARQRLADTETSLAAAATALKNVSAADLPAAQAAQARCLDEFRQAAAALKSAQVAARVPLMQAAVARVAVSAPGGAAGTAITAAAAPADGGRFWKAWKPGGYHLSDAIRSDEVYRVLHELAALSPGEAVAQGLPALVPWKLGNLLQVLNTAGPTTKEAADKIAAALKLTGQDGVAQQGQAILDNVELFGKDIQAAAAQGFDRFQRWFDSCQDRAQQWFCTHTRVITIVCSFIMAFGLKLDVKEIYNQISSDATLRQALVGKAKDVITAGEKALAEEKTPEELALVEWAKSHPTINVTRPLSVKTRDGYVAAIKAAAPADQADAAVKAYTDELDKQANARLEEKKALFKDLSTDLNQTGFQLIPSTSRWPWTGAHFFGVLFMAALLSIGAPFWFNLLKTLTNLRPTISQVIDNKPTQSPAPASGS